MKVIAIIPSAGMGKRMSSPIPKQFLKIYGKEILTYTLESFQKANSIDEVIITVSEEYLQKIKSMVTKYDLRKVKKIVEGGVIRQISVYNALSSIEANKYDLICVHDAVRPFITPKEIDEIISFAKVKKSVIAAEKAKDTIKIGKSFVQKTLDRNLIWNVQTPQVFQFAILKKAFEESIKFKYNATDEASLVERIGKRVYIYSMSTENRKITTKTDLTFAKFFFGKYRI